MACRLSGFGRGLGGVGGGLGGDGGGRGGDGGVSQAHSVGGQLGGSWLQFASHHSSLTELDTAWQCLSALPRGGTAVRRTSAQHLVAGCPF